MQTLPVQVENSRYDMSPAEARTVKFLRFSEGGYQRELSEVRVTDIATSLEKKQRSSYPEITLANVKGVLQCVDGQHRLLGHIKAGVACPVNVISCSQQEAVEIFCRDNGKSRKLTALQLTQASPARGAVDIRSLSNNFKASITQVRWLLQGLRGGSGLSSLHEKDFAFTDPELRAATVVLEAWTRNPGFIYWQNPSTVAEREHYRKYKGTWQAAFSSSCTFWLLGRLCKLDMNNLNKMKRTVKILELADWKRNGARSLRGLQGNAAKNRKELYEYTRSHVLLPAMEK